MENLNEKKITPPERKPGGYKKVDHGIAGAIRLAKVKTRGSPASYATVPSGLVISGSGGE